jgi:hypothetical protein
MVRRVKNTFIMDVKNLYEENHQFNLFDGLVALFDKTFVICLLLYFLK